MNTIQSGIIGSRHLRCMYLAGWTLLDWNVLHWRYRSLARVSQFVSVSTLVQGPPLAWLPGARGHREEHSTRSAPYRGRTDHV